MKFGISYNTAVCGLDPDNMAAVARHAEECGFESFYVSEHIVLYPGAKAGAVEFPPSLAVADPLECLTFVAATTERILLGTAVLLLPYHHPVVLAKQLATLDVLSKGRMRLLAVGLGVLPGEAEAMGVDFAARGRRADEAIDVLRLLWAGGEEGVSFEGEFFSFQNLCSFPKPLNTSTLPVHVGGSSRAAARVLPRRQAHRRRARRPDRDHAGSRGGRRQGPGRTRVHALGLYRHVRGRCPGPCQQRHHAAGRGRRGARPAWATRRDLSVRGQAQTPLNAGWGQRAIMTPWQAS